MKSILTWQQFEAVEMRVGTITDAKEFAEAKKPAYKLYIDFGERIGVKKTSAQITRLYAKEELIGKQVVAVINFPPKQIANFMSECLVLGVVGQGDDVVLLQPDQAVENGLRIS